MFTNIANFYAPKENILQAESLYNYFILGNIFSNFSDSKY